MRKRVVRVAKSIAVMSAMSFAAAHAAGPAFRIEVEGYPAGRTVSNTQVFKGFGCAGENLSPKILWRNAPAGTQSYAVTIFDPDAPTGSGFWHWVVFDIPEYADGLPEGASRDAKAQLPLGTIEGHTDFAMKAYGGPCPPQGSKPHRYLVTVYALKVPTLSLPADATGALVSYMARANMLARASTTANYGRPAAGAKAP